MLWKLPWRYADQYHTAKKHLWKVSTLDVEIAGYVRQVHNFTQVIISLTTFWCLHSNACICNIFTPEFWELLLQLKTYCCPLWRAEMQKTEDVLVSAVHTHGSISFKIKIALVLKFVAFCLAWSNPSLHHDSRFTLRGRLHSAYIYQAACTKLFKVQMFLFCY